MSFLLFLAAQLGIAERFRRLFAWIVLIAGGGLAAWAAVGAFNAWADARYRAKVEAQSAKGREIAAEQRAADAVRNTKTEEDMHHAIDTAPKGGQLSPAAHALACQRLRARGRAPASCGPQGSDGKQAGAE